jgi:hypothetical protein
MTVPDQFPNRIRSGSATAEVAPGELAAGSTAGSSTLIHAEGSWPWRRAALLLSGAAQLITISALVSADPIPASWAALLLAVAPAPLAGFAAYAPVPAARLSAAVLTVVVLITGIIAQITHTGLFFVPALVAMIVAAIRMRRER